MRLAKDENILHDLKPMKRLIVLWLFTRCVPHALTGAIGSFFLIYGYQIFAFKDGDAPMDYGFVGTGAVLMFILVLTLSYVYNRFLIATIRYLVTDRRCVWSGGILRKVEHTVSYLKITDVERSQNIVEQVLNISTINLFTPGTASVRMNARSQPMPELRLEGLAESDELAESINEQVRSYGGRQGFGGGI